MGSDWVVDSVLESGYQPGVPHQQFVNILLVCLPAFGPSGFSQVWLVSHKNHVRGFEYAGVGSNLYLQSWCGIKKNRGNLSGPLFLVILAGAASFLKPCGLRVQVLPAGLCMQKGVKRVKFEAFELSSRGRQKVRNKQEPLFTTQITVSQSYMNAQ